MLLNWTIILPYVWRCNYPTNTTTLPRIYGIPTPTAFYFIIKIRLIYTGIVVSDDWWSMMLIMRSDPSLVTYVYYHVHSFNVYYNIYNVSRIYIVLQACFAGERSRISLWTYSRSASRTTFYCSMYYGIHNKSVTFYYKCCTIRYLLFICARSCDLEVVCIAL